MISDREIKEMKKDSPREMFYLGEKAAEQTIEKQREPAYRISYGGDLPPLMEHYQPPQRTNEDMQRARERTERIEHKVMMDRRMLYLERREQEILGYMIAAEERGRSRRPQLDRRMFLLLVVAGASLLYLLSVRKLLSLLAGLAIFIGCIFVLHSILTENQREKLRRMSEWNQQLEELHKEHEVLAEEKEQLMRELDAMEDRFRADS